MHKIYLLFSNNCDERITFDFGVSGKGGKLTEAEPGEAGSSYSSVYPASSNSPVSLTSRFSMTILEPGVGGGGALLLVRGDMITASGGGGGSSRSPSPASDILGVTESTAH